MQTHAITKAPFNLNVAEPGTLIYCPEIVEKAYLCKTELLTGGQLALGIKLQSGDSHSVTFHYGLNRWVVAHDPVNTRITYEPCRDIKQAVEIFCRRFRGLFLTLSSDITVHSDCERSDELGWITRSTIAVRDTAPSPAL